jgi:hypothetical protein
MMSRKNPLLPPFNTRHFGIFSAHRACTRLAIGSVLVLITAIPIAVAQRSTAPTKLPQVSITKIEPNPFAPGSEVKIQLPTSDNWANITVTFNGKRSPSVRMSGGDVYAVAPRDLPPNSQIEIALGTAVQPVSISARTRGGVDALTALVVAFSFVVGAAGLAFAFRKTRQMRELVRKLNQSESQLDQTRFDFKQIAAGSDNAQAGEILPVPNIPEELIEACLNRNIVLVAGEGIATMAGRPSWQETIAQLISKKYHGTDSSWTRDALAQLSKGRYEFALSAVQSRSDPNQLSLWLREAYGEKTNRQEQIVNLFRRIPLSGAIVCSFDDTLAKVLSEQNAFSREDFVSFNTSTEITHSTFLHSNVPFLFKPFGDLAEQSDLILTNRTLRDRIEDKPMLRKFLTSLFATKCFFFVGMSAETVIELLSTLGIREATNQKHFALVMYEKGIEIIAETCRRQYNLELLPFVASAGYPEVVRRLSVSFWMCAMLCAPLGQARALY